MKFKRGSMVEVLSNKDSLGAWRCAEIVEDSESDGYTVRYYRCPGIAKDGVNKVSAEAIRPCPRAVAVIKDLSVGDVVEVLDGGYWRVSVIEEVLEDDYYFIKVIGSLDEFRVKNTSIRERQEWKEDKWIPMDKGSENYWDLTRRMRKKSYVQSQGKSLKRSFPDHEVPVKEYSKLAKKQRLADKEVMLDAIHGDSYSFIGKVDNSANQRGIRGKNDVLIFNEKSIKQNRGKNGNHNDFPFLERTIEDDCVSSLSSAASCSFTNAISDRLVSNFTASCSKDSDSLCSDAESHSFLGVEDEVSDGQVESVDPLREHELNLRSYRSVLESLYVSGPLSWVQEIALTNLRMRLCVSNDEHLTELRRLKSSGLSCN